MNAQAEIKAHEVVSKTLDKLAKSPSINLTDASADRMKTAITREMSSVIVNQTNQEPWYQSRVTWGAIMAVVAGGAGLVGYSFTAEDQAFWLNNIEQGVQIASSAVALLGGAYAWYGRWRAKKPLGE
jgi:hypothetical protein